MSTAPPDSSPTGDPPDKHNPFSVLTDGANNDGSEDDDDNSYNMKDDDDPMKDDHDSEDEDNENDNNMTNDDNTYSPSNTTTHPTTHTSKTPTTTQTSQTHSTTHRSKTARTTHTSTTHTYPPTNTNVVGINPTNFGIPDPTPHDNNTQTKTPPNTNDFVQRILKQTPHIDLTTEDIPERQLTNQPITQNTTQQPLPQSFAQTAQQLNDNNEGWTHIPLRTNPKAHKHNTSPPSTKTDDTWDEDDQQLLHTSDDATKERRINEGRNNLDRPVVWIYWVLSTKADIHTTPRPSVLEFERVLDTLIMAADLPFYIDRAWVKSKKKGLKIKQVEHIITYAALCPTPTIPTDTSRDNDRLYQLNNKLFQLFNTENALKVEDPKAIFNHCRFTIPHVNDNGQSIHFLLRGIDPSFLLIDKRTEEIFTQRKLAADIIAHIKTHLQLAFPSTALPQCLTSIDEQDILNVTSIISIRRMIFEDRNKDKDSPDRSLPILAIVMSDRHELTTELSEVIHDICHTQNTPLFIGGGKIQLYLTPVPTTKDSNQQRIECFKNTHSFNKTLATVPMSNTLKHSHFELPTHLIFDYQLLSDLVNFTLTDCIAIFVNLQHGLTNPTLACVFKQTLTTKFLRLEEVEYAIDEAIQNTTSPTLTEPAHARSHNITYPPNIRSTTPTKSSRGGRTSHRPSGLFKSSPISSFIDSSKDDPWHAICNGRGGSSTANVYKCHFDNDNLRYLTNGIPFERHFSYPTKEQAFHALQRYYPWIKTYDDLDKMNANAPLNASNLNNPSPLIRQAVGDYDKRKNTPSDMFWTDNTSDPIIDALRTASTQRMKALNASPTESHDFLDPMMSSGEFSYPVTTITLNCLRQYKNENDSTSTTLEQKMPPPMSPTKQRHVPTSPNPTDTRTTIDVTHVTAAINNQEDDAVSQLSTSLSVGGNISTSGSALQSSPKRRRQHSIQLQPQQPHALKQPSLPAQQPLTFLNFITDINTKPNDLRTTIMTTFQQRTDASSSDQNTQTPPFPQHAISTYIHFSMITGQQQFKLGHIQILKPEHSTAIADFIMTLPSTRNVTISQQTPSTAFDVNHIDESKPADSTHPLNCRFTGCQLHNLGVEPPKEILPDTHYANLEEHTIQYHHDILYLASHRTLTNIGWHCCPGCNVRIFTTVKFNTHKSGCAEFTKYSLIQSCPEQHVQQLIALIESNTDITTIKGQIYDWTNPVDTDPDPDL